MDAFTQFINDAASDCVNGPAQRVECRSCGDTRRCQDWTLHVKDVVIHDEGFSDTAGQTTTGQCDDCLKAYGPDDDCVVPDDDPRTEGEIRAEREYRDRDRGEL